MLKEAAGPAWLAGMGMPHFWVDVNGEAGGSLAASASADQRTPTRGAPLRLYPSHGGCLVERLGGDTGNGRDTIGGREEEQP